MEKAIILKLNIINYFYFLDSNNENKTECNVLVIQQWAKFVLQWKGNNYYKSYVYWAVHHFDS